MVYGGQPNPSAFAARQGLLHGTLRLDGAKNTENCLLLMGFATNPLPNGAEIALQSEVDCNVSIY